MWKTNGRYSTSCVLGGLVSCFSGYFFCFGSFCFVSNKQTNRDWLTFFAFFFVGLYLFGFYFSINSPVGVVALFDLFFFAKKDLPMITYFGVGNKRELKRWKD